jgi:hypothetical protein
MNQLNGTGHRFYGYRVGFIGINNTPAFKLFIYECDAVSTQQKSNPRGITEQSVQAKS